ncbi:helix-turn-helix transcriptional regulator [Pedobacter gandavensis]|uniref:helix-turn-helix transcriptional regulator n=1 Tax=Pedobacter gandavensis TaxID=2679963 RepID=UPI00293003F4|nr:helix-turn-helix transcriptional regulator [Pedobacter gandavensis]
MNPIVTFIKAKRKQLKLTQVDVAFKSGVGLRFIRELEQGKTTVRLDKVNQVLYLFGKQVGITDMDRPEEDEL